jgi:hypothetical protein
MPPRPPAPYTPIFPPAPPPPTLHPLPCRLPHPTPPHPAPRWRRCSSTSRYLGSPRRRTSARCPPRPGRRHSPRPSWRLYHPRWGGEVASHPQSGCSTAAWWLAIASHPRRAPPRHGRSPAAAARHTARRQLVITPRPATPTHRRRGPPRLPAGLTISAAACRPASRPTSRALP